MKTANKKAEAVTQTGPRPPSNLHEGMPIADKRVGFGKGAGKWLEIFCAGAIGDVLLFGGDL